MSKNLVKEVITTETEKFTEDGKIKERVKETREKIYEVLTPSEEGSPVEIEPEKVEATEEVDQNKKLIEEAAKAVDSKKEGSQPQTSEQSTTGYNVVKRDTPFPMGPSINTAPVATKPPVFPWEQNK